MLAIKSVMLMLLKTNRLSSNPNDVMTVYRTNKTQLSFDIPGGEAQVEQHLRAFFSHENIALRIALFGMVISPSRRRGKVPLF